MELRRKGEGLAIYNRLDEEQVPIKASQLHPRLTLQLEPIAGKFHAGFSQLEAYPACSMPGEAVIKHTYDNTWHVRDRGGRELRRAERAKARLDLRARYERYRLTWQKPDLDVGGRFRTIRAVAKERKALVKTRIGDRVMRRLAYNVIEFDKLQTMAALRLTLREERATLAAEGKLRPLSYRIWVEQEALSGDVAAISQLRGWTYRAKRKDFKTDSIVYCAPGDDIDLLEKDDFSPHIRRDGVVVYGREGWAEVADYGDRIEVVNVQDRDALYFAVSAARHKSGEHIRFSTEPQFERSACSLAGQHNYLYLDDPIRITHFEQANQVSYEVFRLKQGQVRAERVPQQKEKLKWKLPSPGG